MKPMLILNFSGAKRMRVIGTPAHPSSTPRLSRYPISAWWTETQNKVPCLGAQYTTSSNQSRVKTSNYSVTSLTPMTTKPCAPQCSIENEL